MENKLGAILCWMELKERTNFVGLNSAFPSFLISRCVFRDVCKVTVLCVFGTEEVLANKASPGTHLSCSLDDEDPAAGARTLGKAAPVGFRSLQRVLES